MIKRTIAASLGFFCVCLPLIAQSDETFTREQLQQTGEIDAGPALALYRPDVFNNVDRSVLIHGLPVLALLDGRRILASSALGRMGMTPLDLFPVALLSGVDVQRYGSSPRSGSDGTGGAVNLRLRRDYGLGGEAGVFFGKSGGRYGREDFETYMVGTVGNDKVQITAGASYQETTIHAPRLAR